MTNLSVADFVPRESTKAIASYRRESSFHRELALIDLDKGGSVLEARFYGAASTCYCVVWVHAWRYGLASARGCGKAAGYGYHKPSAALDAALSDAGFTFTDSIHGVGDSAMESALKAIAERFGATRYMIHSAHA